MDKARGHENQKYSGVTMSFWLKRFDANQNKTTKDVKDSYTLNWSDEKRSWEYDEVWDVNGERKFKEWMYVIEHTPWMTASTTSTIQQIQHSISEKIPERELKCITTTTVMLSKMHLEARIFVSTNSVGDSMLMENSTITIYCGDTTISMIR